MGVAVRNLPSAATSSLVAPTDVIPGGGGQTHTKGGGGGGDGWPALGWLPTRYLRGGGGKAGGGGDGELGGGGEGKGGAGSLAGAFGAGGGGAWEPLMGGGGEREFALGSEMLPPPFDMSLDHRAHSSQKVRRRRWTGGRPGVAGPWPLPSSGSTSTSERRRHTHPGAGGGGGNPSLVGSFGGGGERRAAAHQEGAP